MNNQKTILFIIFSLLSLGAIAQNEDSGYITFNDRRNVVHGVYMGLGLGFGEIAGEPTYIGSFKAAYVANHQFEVGFSAKILYSNQNFFNPITDTEDDIFAGYAGFHFEPILFGASAISLSFPVFVGGGAVGYVDGYVAEKGQDISLIEDEVDAIFVVEPGINALFNISRYFQIEAGLRYRFSSTVDLEYSPVERINGLSMEVGFKMGIFNMGKNRYKQQLDQ